MKTFLRPLLCSLLFAAALPQNAGANLIANGDFTALTYTGTKPVTTIFGQFGNNSGSTTGSQITVSGWDTAGYNFVYAPGTADAGTKATGANAGAPNQAPGQYNSANGYGGTYMWGSQNGGLNVITPIPGGGNFVAADGAFQVAPITQSLAGLTVGQTYRLSFSWAGAQQESLDGITTENFKVSFGSQSFTTPTVTNASHGFTGWMSQTFDFTAGATTQTLSFLAQGTPNGQPPFSLFGNVSLDVVPEFSHWSVFAGFGLLCALSGPIRRRLRRAAPVATAAPVA